jgi:hypothetical protein
MCSALADHSTIKLGLDKYENQEPMRGWGWAGDKYHILQLWSSFRKCLSLLLTLRTKFYSLEKIIFFSYHCFVRVIVV